MAQHEINVIDGVEACVDSRHDCFWWHENWPGGRAPARWEVNGERIRRGGRVDGMVVWSARVVLWVPGSDRADLRSIMGCGFATAEDAFRACRSLERELVEERDAMLQKAAELREARMTTSAVPG